MPQLEQHWPRLLAALACVLVALWLSTQGDDQRQVRNAGDALAAGKPAEALQIARKVDDRPAALRARRIEGDALTQLNRPREAVTAYTDAAEMSPNDWTLRRSLAVALAQSGRLSSGRRQLARAEVLNPRIVIAGQLPTP